MKHVYVPMGLAVWEEVTKDSNSEKVWTTRIKHGNTKESSRAQY